MSKMNVGIGLGAAVLGFVIKEVWESTPLPTHAGLIRTTMNSNGKRLPVDVDIIGDTAIVISASRQHDFTMKVTASESGIARFGFPTEVVEQLVKKGLKRTPPMQAPSVADTVERARKYIDSLDVNTGKERA